MPPTTATDNTPGPLIRWPLRLLVLPALLLSLPAAPALALDLDARLKWFATSSALPSHDLQRQLAGTPAFSDNLDLRLLLRHQHGAWSFELDHSTTLLRAAASGSAVPGTTLDQSVASDSRRLLDLTWQLADGNRHQLLHRLDRLAVTWRQGSWRVTAGRQAVSWGNGLVFQPMDLFNPFAPTTVDTDYKPGDDLLLVEHLFANGSDLQTLAVARRDARDKVSGQVGSLGGKWHGFAGPGELDVLFARHYGDTVLGLGLRWPLGGALLRSDLVATRLPTGTWKLSGVLNMDYSLVLGGRNIYLFGEFFHSAFGLRRLPPSPLLYPIPLLERVQRGELFNLMRDYTAVGGSIQWHPLWTQTLTLLTNLHDSSSLLQSQLAHEPDDHQRLELGLVKTFGRAGDEFGGVPLGALPAFGTSAAGSQPATTGGGTRAYLRWTYFF